MSVAGLCCAVLCLSVITITRKKVYYDAVCGPRARAQGREQRSWALERRPLLHCGLRLRLQRGVAPCSKSCLPGGTARPARASRSARPRAEPRTRWSRRQCRSTWEARWSTSELRPRAAGPSSHSAVPPAHAKVINCSKFKAHFNEKKCHLRLSSLYPDELLIEVDSVFFADLEVALAIPANVSSVITAKSAACSRCNTQSTEQESARPREEGLGACRRGRYQAMISLTQLSICWMESIGLKARAPCRL
jgi:hypothetical protein